MYKITENYIFVGYWSFPGRSADWLSGILNYDPSSKKAELIAWGPLKNIKIDFYNDTVIGRTTDEEKITLINCIIRERSRKIIKTEFDDVIYKYTIEANGILIGENFYKYEDISFSCINLCYSNQIWFIQKTGFKVEPSVNSPKVKYKRPKNILFTTYRDLSINIKFNL